MLKRCFLLLLLIWQPIPAQSASAENTAPQTSGSHFFIVMPLAGIYLGAEREEDYEGVSFPLYCGIASIYPRDNIFIFTKTTDLPIRYIEQELRAIEQNKYFDPRDRHRPPVQVPLSDPEALYDFPWFARNNHFWAFRAYYGRQIPIKATPRFTLTCPFKMGVPLSEECQQTLYAIDELFIPVTEEERRQMRQDDGE